MLLLCALIVVACGKLVPILDDLRASSRLLHDRRHGAGSATTGSTGAGSTNGATSSTGTSGSTQTPRRHVKKAGKAGSPASASPRRRVKATALRRCLEQNGIKTHTSGSKAATRGQLQEALKRCDPQLARRTGSSRPASGLRRKLLARPGYRQALARFTSCMRKHGLPNFPEANTSGKGPLYPAGVVKPTPQVHAAQRACIGQLSSLH